MSYRIGQFRRNQKTLAEYQVQLETGKVTTYDTSITDNLTVRNSMLALRPDSSPVQKNTMYYIRFKVGTYSLAPFRLVLTNSEGTKKMTIKRINPVAGQEYEAIFMPNSEDYNTLVFERIRNNASDNVYSTIPIDSNSIKLYELKNVIPESKLYQIGLQGPPGMLFSINGEELRIGKSGRYELQGITVSHLGFMIKNTSPIPYADGLDYFILDYYY